MKSTMTLPTSREECCRVLLLGAARARVAKVFSLIQQADTTTLATVHRNVSIQYLPCVATFDSYPDADGSRRIRYLSKVEYFPDGTQVSPEGLLPFVDDDLPSSASAEPESKQSAHGNSCRPLFQGISCVVIGSGIERVEDVEMIRKFIETLSRKELPIEVVRPNTGYATMQEELEAYRALGVEEKERAMQDATMGPAKMARCTVNVAHRLVDLVIDDDEQRRQAAVKEAQELQSAASTKLPKAELPPLPEINANTNRYACRKCRTILFGLDNLQDPPHVPAKHKFSHRKQHLTGGKDDQCQSLFLKDDVQWLGDMCEEEGKLSCPRCLVKIGGWHWSGAQCSCGTWVVPAVQVPISKVDLVQPRQRDAAPLIAERALPVAAQYTIAS